MHVHLREPGYEHKETVATGAASAVAGGFTAVACMPNTNPVNDSASVTRFILKQAAEANLARVYPIGAVSKGSDGEQLAEIADMREAGCVAFSDDGRPVATALLMRRALEYAGMFGMPVIDHCEDKTLAGEGVAHEGFNASQLGLRGIPGAAEDVMVERDIVLAAMTGGHAHIAHLSTAGALRAVQAGKARGVKVTCEVAPHHFTLTDDRLLAPLPYDTNLKMNPPLRENRDRASLLEGLRDGTVDAIATDHAPHHADDKQVEFDRAPFGIVGLETARVADLRPAGAPGRDQPDAHGRAAVGEPGAHPRRARRAHRRGRRRRHHHPRAGPAGDRVGGGVQVEVAQHAVRRLVAARRRGRHHRRRARAVREPGRRRRPPASRGEPEP